MYDNKKILKYIDKLDNTLEKLILRIKIVEREIIFLKKTLIIKKEEFAVDKIKLPGWLYRPSTSIVKSTEKKNFWDPKILFYKNYMFFKNVQWTGHLYLSLSNKFCSGDITLLHYIWSRLKGNLSINEGSLNYIPSLVIKKLDFNTRKYALTKLLNFLKTDSFLRFTTLLDIFLVDKSFDNYYTKSEIIQILYDSNNLWSNPNEFLENKYNSTIDEFFRYDYKYSFYNHKFPKSIILPYYVMLILWSQHYNMAIQVKVFVPSIKMSKDEILNYTLTNMGFKKDLEIKNKIASFKRKNRMLVQTKSEILIGENYYIDYDKTPFSQSNRYKLNLIGKLAVYDDDNLIKSSEKDFYLASLDDVYFESLKYKKINTNILKSELKSINLFKYKNLVKFLERYKCIIDKISYWDEENEDDEYSDVEENIFINSHLSSFKTEIYKDVGNLDLFIEEDEDI